MSPVPGPVSSIQHLHGRIDDTTSGRTPPGGAQRAVPYHCPFCAEQDLHPHDADHGAWHCRSCLRVFAVRFLGLEPLTPLPEGGPR